MSLHGWAGSLWHVDTGLGLVGGPAVDHARFRADHEGPVLHTGRRFLEFAASVTCRSSAVTLGEVISKAQFSLCSLNG